MKTRLHICFISIAVLLLSSTLAFAEGPTPDKRFEDMLRAVDVVPTRTLLEGTWSDSRERLMQAAGDTTLDMYPRLRALSMLGAFPEEGVRKYLIAQTNDANPDIRRTAYYTLGRTFGAPADDALIAELRRGLADEDENVRRHTILVLRWVEHPEVTSILTSLAKSHDDQTVRQLADQTLSRRN